MSYKKSVTVCSLVLAIFVGIECKLVNTHALANTYVSESDSAIENPWSDELKDSEETESIVTNAGGNSETGSTNSSDQGDEITKGNLKSKFKKSLKIKIISATKKSKKSKKAKIILKQVKNAEGYQIKYSTTKKFKVSKTKNFKKNKFMLRKLKSDKSYYIKVRAYGKFKGKKVYGKWSAKKKVKVSKKNRHE